MTHGQAAFRQVRVHAGKLAGIEQGMSRKIETEDEGAR